MSSVGESLGQQNEALRCEIAELRREVLEYQAALKEKEERWWEAQDAWEAKGQRLEALEEEVAKLRALAGSSLASAAVKIMQEAAHRVRAQLELIETRFGLAYRIEIRPGAPVVPELISSPAPKACEPTP